MGKQKIELILDDEIIEKIKEMLEKQNTSPFAKMHFNSISEYMSYVITNQIKQADKFSEKLKDKIQDLTKKFKEMGLDDMDVSEAFGEKKKEEPKGPSDKPADKNVKN